MATLNALTTHLLVIYFVGAVRLAKSSGCLVSCKGLIKNEYRIANKHKDGAHEAWFGFRRIHSLLEMKDAGVYDLRCYACIYHKNDINRAASAICSENAFKGDDEYCNSEGKAF